MDQIRVNRLSVCIVQGELGKRGKETEPRKEPCRARKNPKRSKVFIDLQILGKGGGGMIHVWVVKQMDSEGSLPSCLLPYFICI